LSIYLKYLWIVIKHKWFILSCVRRTGISFLPRLLLHDMSKFLPSEFVPYARYWCKAPERRTEQEIRAYERAKRLHHSRNKHHWQWWLERSDEEIETLYPIPMDFNSLIELVCDWRAAGLAYKGVDDSKNYYVREGPEILFIQKLV
jgi:hypothetical protein